MKLNVGERLQFGVLLPERGDFVTLTLKADIVKKVALTQKELTDWEVKVTDGVASWNPAKAEAVDIEFTEAEKSLIVKKLKQLDADKQLDDLTVLFYQKFI